MKWFEEGYRVSLSCKQKAKIDSTFLGTLQFYLSIIENNTGSTEEEKGRKKMKGFGIRVWKGSQWKASSKDLWNFFLPKWTRIQKLKQL